jgi:Cu+-exporting ATPase
MVKKTSLLVLFLVFSVAFVMAAVDKKTSDESLRCPVSGKEITRSDATPKYEYEGRTYYFCCEGCKEKFVENPAKYIGKEEHAHATEHAHEASPDLSAGCAHAEHADHDHQAQAEKDGMVVDPVCGMKIDKEDAKATYEHNGKTFYFCMEECKDKFVKEPDTYISADDGVVKCPVSGESFKKSEFTESMDYEGKTYYFCCAGCKDKFEKNPEKYVQK